MKPKSISYWITTGLLAFLIGGGGVSQALHMPWNVEGAVHILGYPAYFLTIIGIWKVLGAIAILVPRYPRLKEWAYAGIFFDLTGAAWSHVETGDVGAYWWHVIATLALMGLAVASWALRPESRVLGTLTVRIAGKAS
jgi:DoxX-like family